MLGLCVALFAAGGALHPDRLQCEYRVNPVGIDAAVPRLSWIVTSNERDQRQTAYEIRASHELATVSSGDAWDSGKVESDQTVGVDYHGPTPKSGERLYWTVTTWDAQGRESSPSKPAYFEMGILPFQQFPMAHWISIPGTPCPYLRKDFSVHGRIKSARLYATARGLYRFSIDGKPIGKGELTPGWTDFTKREAYQTYDVTSALRPGNHAMGMRLGDGWYSGHVGWSEAIYGKFPSGLAHVRIEYTDGTTEDVDTDHTWKSSGGPVVYSDTQMGETYDARLEMPGWDKPGFDDSKWGPVNEEGFGAEQIVAQKGPLVEKLMELKVQKVTQVKPGVFICDLGQNMVGWAQLKVRGQAGDKVTMRFGEMLNPDGTLYTANLRKAKATDTYILRGGANEVFEPSFTFHGFRYVEVTGYPGEFDANDLKGEVVGSNMPQTGWFQCSSDMVNKLQHNIVWGMRGNYLDVPTDCPQRDERLGWMGDAETFIPTATFNSDVDGFMTKWTQDVADGQTAVGAFRDVSPAVVVPLEGAPAWGDAGVIVPWNVYLAYSDKRLLAQRMDSMRNWVNFIEKNNPTNLWLNHRGNDYGDWLNVNDETPKEIVATAFYANSVRIVADAEHALAGQHKARLEPYYEILWQKIKSAFAAKYIDADGRVMGDNQSGYVLALAFDLVPKELRQKAGDRLNELVMVKCNAHLSTGFVGVGRLMQALEQTGHTDTCYKLLLQTTYPSWLYPITQGATTIWERWDGYRNDKGFQNPGMNSFNHYSLGSVGDWMYASLGGIALDPKVPGYKHILVSPEFGEGLTWAKAKLSSVHGDIETSWKLNGKKLSFDLVVPANTTATVSLPGQAKVEVGSGSHHYETTVG